MAAQDTLEERRAGSRHTDDEDGGFVQPTRRAALSKAIAGQCADQLVDPDALGGRVVGIGLVPELLALVDMPESLRIIASAFLDDRQRDVQGPPVHCAVAALRKSPVHRLDIAMR